MDEHTAICVLAENIKSNNKGFKEDLTSVVSIKNTNVGHLQFNCTFSHSHVTRIRNCEETFQNFIVFSW